MANKITRTTNSVSDALRMTAEEILVKKHKKGHEVHDIDIIAINEWIEKKDGVDLFNLLRAFALLCNTVDGLEEHFFTIAKELPNKLELSDLSTESIMENFEEVDREKITPYDYIKTMQNIFKDTENSRKFVENFDNNFLKDSLETLINKFKIITMEEYNNLVNKDSNSLNKSKNITENSFVEYANNLDFKRIVLRDAYVSEK